MKGRGNEREMFEIIEKKLKAEEYGLEEYFKNWPMLYILENGRRAYIGQSLNVTGRMGQHKVNPEKISQKFKKVYFVYSDEFNLSVLLDYEAQLIRMMAADGKYIVTNKNRGITDKRYFNKEYYEKQFETLWEELRKRGIADHSTATIEGLDLFKYSPYKTLTEDQQRICAQIFRERNWNKANTVIVEGLPGSGKTILAVYLFKLLKESKKTKDMEMALVVPQESFRATLKKLFKSLDGLMAKDVIGPYDVLKKDYQILIVDEGHRLQGTRAINYGKRHLKVNETLGLSENADQMDWIIKRSTVQVILYDQLQVVGPSGIEYEKLNDKTAQRAAGYYKLYSQMRVKGGSDYLEYICGLLSGTLVNKKNFRKYDFKLFKKFSLFNRLLYEREKKFGLCRMAAGYAWRWKSKEDKTGTIQDIVIDGIEKRWNTSVKGWVNSQNAINEVGCIHTVQGYDLNYAFVIIGEEFKYRDGRLIIDRKRYYDQNGKKTATNDELWRYIRNIYYVLMSRGILGTYIYVCDEELRNYFSQYVESYKE